MTVVVHRTTRDVLTVEGPEAVTWLQGQLSQDVAALVVGATAPTFVLAPQGKVEGWGRLHRNGDEAVQIDVDTGAGELWLARLERFKLRTKAELTLRSAVPVLAVRGERPEGALAAGWPGVDGADLIDPADQVLDELVARGAVEIDAEAFEALRITAGVPRWGTEIDPETIPATLGRWVIDASVSFTKGCYTGQELVARIDSRGGNVPRRLVTVVVDGPVPTPGAEVVVDGSPVGSVTSSAPDPATRGSVALAFVVRAVSVPATGQVDGHPADLGPQPVPAAG